MDKQVNVIVSELGTDLLAEVVRLMGKNSLFNFSLITHSGNFPGIERYDDILRQGKLSTDVRLIGGIEGRECHDLDSIMPELLYMLKRYVHVGESVEAFETNFIRKLVGYWRDYLIANKIGLVLFSTIPHAMYDYIIYELCKKMGVLTVYIEKTVWPDRIILAHDFKSKNSLLTPEAGASRFNLSDLKDYIKHLDSTSLPYWTQYKLKKYDNSDSFLSKLFKAFKDGSLWGRLRDRRSGIFWGKVYEAESLEKKNVFWHLWAKRCIAIRRKNILRDYEYACVHNLDMIKGKPYVVFFLQCQPEKSTSPVGGVFADQLRAIGLLREWIPRSIEIVVREHPTQFKPFQRVEKGRTPDYYTRLKNLGVHLCHHESDKAILVENSLAILSVSGTVVFEQFLLGKHAAYMGYPWYKDIQGVPRVYDCHTAQEFIQSSLSQKIKNPDIEMIGDFISNCHLGYMDLISGQQVVDSSNNLLVHAESINASICNYVRKMQGIECGDVVPKL